VVGPCPLSKIIAVAEVGARCGGHQLQSLVVAGRRCRPTLVISNCCNCLLRQVVGGRCGLWPVTSLLLVAAGGSHPSTVAGWC